jgi:hypothetical protein
LKILNSAFHTLQSAIKYKEDAISWAITPTQKSPEDSLSKALLQQ